MALLPPVLQRGLPLACCAWLLLGCKPPVSPPAEEPSPGRAALRTQGPGRTEEHAKEAKPAEPRPAEPQVRPFQRCYGEDTALSRPRGLPALLDRAADLYDQAGEALRERRAVPGLPPRAQELYDGSLVCTEEAIRAEPRSVEAHTQRAMTLLELGRPEPARDSFARALALDPDDVRALVGAADLYVNHLTPSVDHTETGLEYARRGSRRVRRTRDKALFARLSLLEGQALNDLGRAREALGRLEASLSADDDVQARYERAVALFDLCRFEEARRAFSDVVARAPDDAWAHHHLGLVLEFLGRSAEAEREFERARKERAQDFPTPLRVTAGEFRSLVEHEAHALPPALRDDLGRVIMETADLPELSDLTAEEPPLSPTILGLFRGAPLGAAPESAPRTIVLYRKNLLRAVQSRDDLQTQVRTTLLHELGHLRGEDDEALRARGLE